MLLAVKTVKTWLVYQCRVNSPSQDYTHPDDSYFTDLWYDSGVQTSYSVLRFNWSIEMEAVKSCQKDVKKVLKTNQKPCASVNGT